MRTHVIRVHLWLIIKIVYFTGAMMLIARLILGIGAGNATLIRIYASAVTSVEERPIAMAWVTGERF